MKKIITSVILTILIFTVFAQDINNCEAPIELKDNYAREVKHIALQRIFEQNSTYIDSIDIPTIYQDSIWSSLAAIFNETSIPDGYSGAC